MQDFLFYIFAFMTLLFGVLVVANPFSRNPVTSAMFLVLTIISLAGLFALLNAYFLAQVQIIVYAGAVIVLFLFVIMLLDIKEEERRRIKVYGLVTGLFAVGGLAAVLGLTFATSGLGDTVRSQYYVGDTASLGTDLFSQGRFLLPFEIVSVLLLVAVVGVILLSKKDLK